MALKRVMRRNVSLDIPMRYLFRHTQHSVDVRLKYIFLQSQ